MGLRYRHITGITPACAGKRRIRSALVISRGDHPRVCGEKVYTTATRGGCWGSPPRVRGKECRVGRKGKARGITPACAGKSFQLAVYDFLARDHPRACGEKSGFNKLERPGAGSPPRVRGKGQHIYCHPVQSGITPARAGKRSGCSCSARG